MSSLVFGMTVVGFAATAWAFVVVALASFAALGRYLRRRREYRERVRLGSYWRSAR